MIADSQVHTIAKQAEEIFYGRKDSSDLELDEQGGRQFLRVLFNLIIFNSGELVTSTLHLLFRHFQQRSELLKTFTQVQLLISTQDVSNYTLVRTELEHLRTLVEKSELWVQNAKKTEEEQSGSAKMASRRTSLNTTDSPSRKSHETLLAQRRAHAVNLQREAWNFGASPIDRDVGHFALPNSSNYKIVKTVSFFSCLFIPRT